jgi:large subunit ribosomal protein L16
MKWGHFEMVRLGVLRKMDQNRMFAVWRIDSPWQPVTRKVLYLASLSTSSDVANV